MSSATQQNQFFLHALEPLQRMQDAFALAFSVPTVIVDVVGRPVTHPSHWLHEPGVGDSRERLAKLVDECGRLGEVCGDVCQGTGVLTAAVPLMIDGGVLGAWILDGIRLEEASERPESGDSGAARGKVRTVSATVYGQMLELLTAMNVAIEEIGRGARDVAARDRQLRGIRDQMDATNAMLRLFIDTSNAAMFICDYYTGEVLMINETCTMLFNGSMRQILGRKCWDLIHPGQESFCLDCPRERLLDENNRPVGSHTWDRYSGHHNKWFRCTSQALTWTHGRLAIMGTIVDVTEERRLREELEQLAFTERRTGQPNARRLIQDLGHRLSLAAKADSPRAGKTERDRPAVTMLGVDLSSLRMVRDTYGRETANQARKAFFSWIMDQDFGDRRFYSIGDDEYCLLFRKADEASARMAAEALVNRFSRPWLFTVDGRQGSCFCTVAVSVIHADSGQLAGMDIVSLLERSLDAARAAGGAIFYDEERDLAIMEKRRLEASLITSVTEGMTGFSVQYQPIVHLESGTWKAYEALCRWTSPEFGPVSPEIFIPDAERLGLIRPIGLWVLDRAAAQIRELGLDRLEGFFLSVNVSPLQLMDAGFADKVEAILVERGLPGNALCLEITESAEVAFNAFTMSVIEKVRRLGVRMALDDFGTGYSTFTNLHNLPANFLKIEKSLAADIEGDRYMRYFYRLMSEMAHADGKRLIAEGIETREQLDLIRDTGADYIQGYFFSRPLPASELPERMERFTRPEPVLADRVGRPGDIGRWLDGNYPYTATPAVLTLLDGCVRRLLADGELEPALAGALNDAVEHFGLDSAFAFVRRDGLFVPVIAHGADAPVKRHPGPVRDRLLIGELNGVFRTNRILLSSDLDAVPPRVMDLFSGGEEERSFAVIPMWEGNELLGFVGFDHRRRYSWTPDSIVTLDTLAMVMANAVKRRLPGAPVKSANEVMTEALNRLGTNVLVSDAESGEILWFNDVLAKHFPDALGILGKKRDEVFRPVGDRPAGPFRTDPPPREHAFHECRCDQWGRSFVVYDVLVEWTPGRMVLLQYLTDLTGLIDASRNGSEDNPQWLDVVTAVEEATRNAGADNAPETSFAYICLSSEAGDSDERVASAMDRIGRAIKECTRTGDYVGRLGSHEFLIVFPACGAGIAEFRVAEVQALLSRWAGGRKKRETDFAFSVVTSSETLLDGAFRFDRLLARARERLGVRARSA